MWIITLLGWSRALLTGMSIGSNMVNILKFLKDYWRESLIVGMLVFIGFSGWYYKGKISRLGSDLQNAEINIETLEGNTDQLNYALGIHNARLESLVDNNKILKDKIREAQVIINDLNNRPPETIIKTVYDTILPEECNGKFHWMLSESFRLRELGK